MSKSIRFKKKVKRILILTGLIFLIGGFFGLFMLSILSMPLDLTIFLLNGVFSVFIVWISVMITWFFIIVKNPEPTNH